MEIRVDKLSETLTMYLQYKGHAIAVVVGTTLHHTISHGRGTTMPGAAIPETVTAVLNYFSPPPDGSDPYIDIVLKGTKAERIANWKLDPRQVAIQNIRGKEKDHYAASLDVTGFQFGQRVTKHKAFDNNADIEREYYPESIELVKEITGGSRVVIFDHTIRRRRPLNSEQPLREILRGPAPQIHVDQTPNTASARVQRHMPSDELSALGSCRFQVLNLWRPVSHPADDWPLALCDCRSVHRSQLIATTVKAPGKETETYCMTYGPDNKWVYLKGMRPDEFVLFKCYDSVKDGSVAEYVPHSAFEDPTTPTEAPLRESIELRFLVFYDE